MEYFMDEKNIHFCETQGKIVTLWYPHAGSACWI